MYNRYMLRCSALVVAGLAVALGAGRVMSMNMAKKVLNLSRDASAD